MGALLLSYEDQEYHRRRAEMELDHAVSAEAMTSAVAHLELARMHRAKRAVLAEQGARALGHRRGPAIRGADKEA